MTVTLTSTYKETLKPETVADIEEKCIEGSYDLNAALLFIDEHSEEEFLDYYETYIECGEDYGYDAVDAFIEINDVDELKSFRDAFVGEYGSPADFALELLENEVGHLAFAIVVDWEATSDNLLMDDYNQEGNFYFRRFF